MPMLLWIATVWPTQIWTFVSNDIGAVKVYFPIVMSIVLSLVLTIVLNILLRLR